MPTDRNIDNQKYIETKTDDTNCTNKQRNKQKVNNRNWLCNKQTCICIVLIQGNEKRLMKCTAVSAKALKALKNLPKILLNIYLMHLCILPCFYILFKRQSESVTKIFLSKVVLENLRCIVNIGFNVTVQMWHTNVL